jgi:hypothetical protein
MRTTETLVTFLSGEMWCCVIGVRFKGDGVCAADGVNTAAEIKITTDKFFMVFRPRLAWKLEAVYTALFRKRQKHRPSKAWTEYL